MKGGQLPPSALLNPPLICHRIPALNQIELRIDVHMLSIETEAMPSMFVDSAKISH